MVKNLYPGENWIPGIMLQELHSVSYLVDVGEGRAWKYHVDHLRMKLSLNLVMFT